MLPSNFSRGKYIRLWIINSSENSSMMGKMMARHVTGVIVSHRYCQARFLIMHHCIMPVKMFDGLLLIHGDYQQYGSIPPIDKI